MEYVRCNLCGSDETRLWGKKSNIKIVRCKNCGLIYCNPRPNNEELKNFYSADYFLDGNYEQDSQRQKMYEIEIEEIKKNIATEGRFLDVGCAVGKFLVTLPDKFEKWGTEFSEAAAEIARKKFGLNIVTGQIRHIELPERYFDIVQMRGVLEHSQNPFEDLVKIHKTLKDDGILRISQLPNIKSLCGRLFKTKFNQVKPGEHLYYFSPITINAMLNKVGFKIKKVNYPYLQTPYASLFKDTIHMLTHLFNGRESPPFFGNMMIIYAKKKKSLGVKKKFSRQDYSKQTEQFSYSKDIANILAKNIGDDFLRYRKRLEKAVRFEEELAYPIHIDFETIFGCNIRCVMCTHARKEASPSRQRLMEFSLFKKIIDEGVKYNLSSIGLDQEGEPFLVRNLSEYISYAGKKGILDIMINTNALLLNKEKTEELLHSELTRLHFSLDAITEETYNKIRLGSDFKKVMENILYFCKRRKELRKELPITRVSFVKMKYNEHEMQSFIDFWNPHVDAVAIQEYNNPFPDNLGVEQPYAKSRIKNKNFRCTQPWFRVVVLSDGTVLPCCLLGYSLKMAIGNAYKQTIYELWNTDSMKRFRRLHKEGRFREHKVCKACAENFV